MSFYYIIDLPEYSNLKFNSLNEVNEFRHKNNIPCKYQKRRKEYNNLTDEQDSESNLW